MDNLSLIIKNKFHIIYESEDSGLEGCVDVIDFSRDNPRTLHCKDYRDKLFSGLIKWQLVNQGCHVVRFIFAIRGNAVGRLGTG
jgi:hypothetical protein